MGIINKSCFEFDRNSLTYELEDLTFWMEFHELCFLCHEKLTIPCVFWQGAPRSRSASDSERIQIWLHPECAESFCMRLLRDVEELRTGNRDAASRKLKLWKAKHDLSR